MPAPHPNPGEHSPVLPDSVFGHPPAGTAALGCSATGRCMALRSFVDEAFRVPAPAFRFGLEGSSGWFPPGETCWRAALARSCPLAAWIRGVPYVTWCRDGRKYRIGRAWSARFPRFGDISINRTGRPNPPQLPLLVHTATWASPTVTPAATGRFCL